MEYKVGDRVRYIGIEIQNSMKANPREDLASGIEGTIVNISKDITGLFPLEIAFDPHKEEDGRQMTWRTKLTEVEKVQAEVTEELTTEQKLSIANYKLWILKQTILALDSEDCLDVFLEEVDMTMKIRIKDADGNVVKTIDESISLKEFLDRIDN